MVEEVKKKNKFPQTPKYTLWNRLKVKYAKISSRKTDGSTLYKCFRVRYKFIVLPIGGFIDFLTCEIIYDLVSSEPEFPKIKKSKWDYDIREIKQIKKDLDSDKSKEIIRKEFHLTPAQLFDIESFIRRQDSNSNYNEEHINKRYNNEDKLPSHVSKHEYNLKNEKKIRYYYNLNGEHFGISSLNLFELKEKIEKNNLPWDWQNTPKKLIHAEKKKLDEIHKSELPLNVYKYVNHQVKQGFNYNYNYKNKKGEDSRISSINLFKLKKMVEAKDLPWDWQNTPEELKKEYNNLNNNSLPLHVSKYESNQYRKGFTYRYYYHLNNKSKHLSSTNLIKLKERVESKGLEWDWLDTPESLKEFNIKENIKLNNEEKEKKQNLPYNVLKYVYNKSKKGFQYKYKYIDEKGNTKFISSYNLIMLKENVEKHNLKWDWLNTPESLKKESIEEYGGFKNKSKGFLKGENNPNYHKTLSDETKRKIGEANRKYYIDLPLNVYIFKDPKYPDGVYYQYRYHDEEGKLKTISSFNLFKLEENVKSKNLEWDWLNTSEDLIIKNTKDYEEYKKEQELKKSNTKLKNNRKEKKVKLNMKIRDYKYSIESKNKMSEAHRKFKIKDAVNIKNDFNKGFTRTQLMKKYGLDKSKINNIFLFIENNPIKILEYEDKHKKGKYPRYIEKNPAGNYSVRLIKNQKRTYIGSYPSLEIAVGVRNILVQYNFFLPSKIIKYNDHYWVINVNDSGKFEYKGHYDTFEEAKSVANEVDMSCIVLQKNGTYLINKSIKDHNTYFGTYYTLEEAVKARDDFRIHDWSVDYFKEVYEENPIIKNKNIYFYRDKYNVVKTFSNGLQKHYGAFETFEEACKVRDELKKNNWQRVKDENKYIEKWGKEEYHIIRSIPKPEPIRQDFGKFPTIKDAKNYRDILVEEGFPEDKIVQVYEDMKYIQTSKRKNGLITYSVRRTIDEERKYYGSSDDLNETKAIRDILIKHNWNIIESDVYPHKNKYVAIHVKPNGNLKCLGIYKDKLKAINKLKSKITKK